MYYGILMSDLFPATTEDERDPREDIDTKRDEDIKADVPPHMKTRGLPLYSVLVVGAGLAESVL